MTSETLLLWLVLALVIVNVLLSVFTLRAFVVLARDTSDNAVQKKVAIPDRGFRLSLDDDLTWPSSVMRVFDDEVWVAFVVMECLSCQILREEFDSDLRAHPDLVVIAAPDDSPDLAREYLNDFWSFAAERIVAPKGLEQLTGFGGPNEFPTLVALRQGEVVASAHRLAHLRRKLEEVGLAART